MSWGIGRNAENLPYLPQTAGALVASWPTGRLLLGPVQQTDGEAPRAVGQAGCGVRGGWFLGH
jgi:hypothetical protein